MFILWFTILIELEGSLNYSELGSSFFFFLQREMKRKSKEFELLVYKSLRPENNSIVVWKYFVRVEKLTPLSLLYKVTGR